MSAPRARPRPSSTTWGTGTAQAHAKRRQPGGPFASRAEGLTLRVVGKYRHLGSIISSTGRSLPEGRRRVAAGAETYVPIACERFGSRHIPVDLKLDFVRSLVMSRRFFHAHVFVLCVVHMRVLRNTLRC